MEPEPRPYEFALVISPGQTDEFVRKLLQFIEDQASPKAYRLYPPDLSQQKESFGSCKTVIRVSLTSHEMNIVAEHSGLLDLAENPSSREQPQENEVDSTNFEARTCICLSATCFLTYAHL